MTGESLIERRERRSLPHPRARRVRPRGSPLHCRTATFRTPAFVPLASTAHGQGAARRARSPSWATRWCSATPSTCSSSPAHEHIAAHGRPARVHGLAAADHHRLGRLPGLLDGSRLGGRGDQGPARGRAPAAASSSIDEEGVRFRSYIDGAERFMGPETSMEVQAALGSDIALAFDECTPFHVERDYTARSTRAHAPLARPLRRLAARATRPSRPAALRDRAGRRLRGPARGVRRACRRRRTPTASRSAARSGRRRSRCARWWAGRCGRCPTSSRATCWASATWTTSCAPSPPASTRFDCATPTRLGRHGTALVPDPESRWRLDLTRPRLAREPRADPGGLPLPGVPRPHARLPALPRAAPDELTGSAPDHAPQPHLHAAR